MAHLPVDEKSSGLNRRNISVLFAGLFVLTACGSEVSDENGSPDGGGEDAEGPAGSVEEGPESLGSVVWADWGGPSSEGNVTVYHEDFEEETGVSVTTTTRADAIAFDMFDGGDGDYDVISSSLYEAYYYFDALAEIPTREYDDDVVPEDLRDYTFGSFMFGSAQGYLEDEFPDGGPETWEDFYDFENFPGMRAVPGDAAMFDYMFEAALLADGVDPEDLWPLDIDRALEKMDELQGNVIFYQEYPEVQQLLATGSVSIAHGPHAQFADLNNSTPTAINWNQGIIAPLIYVIPETAPNRDKAMALAEFYSDPERQAEYAEITGNGPSNSAAFEYLEEETAANLPNSPENLPQVIEADQETRSEQRDDLIEAYGNWLQDAQ